ncbi:LysE family translocator [Staphylococcus chromogenes]|nr:LysE family translocator [Staphylococcus chromogenes]
MNLAELGTILLLNLAGMLAPGPDVFLIMRTGAKSRRHALAVVAGISTGIVFWATLTVLGTSALFAANPSILGFIQFFGGMWLMWMGRGLLKSGLEQRLNRIRPGDVGLKELVGTLAHNYRLGLMTNLSNPKAVLFFASIMSPFIPVGAPWTTSALIVVALALCTLAGFSGLALLVSADVIRRRIVHAGPWIDIVAGLLFVGVGLWMFVQGLFAVVGPLL